MPSKKEIKKEVKLPNEVETVLEWIAPGRPFKARSKQYYLTALLIMLFVEIVLFLFKEFPLMFVVAALVFVSFALASVPPRNFRYRISNQGIQIEDNFFIWQELYDFYFYKKGGIEEVHIGTKNLLPGELIMTMGEEQKEKIKKALLPYLPFREHVEPTFMDKAADWLARNFPLENK